MKPSLIGESPETIRELTGLNPAFRSRQIYAAICRGVNSFEAITSLPKTLREELDSRFSLSNSTVDAVLRDPDGTAKLRLRLADEAFIESVLLRDRENRRTACVSSQVGCAMGCAFCRTGTMGLARNLTPGEILEQYFHLREHFGEIDNIVFMGMGEPLANFTALEQALRILTDPQGMGLSARRITVSTCGLIAGIDRLRQTGLPIRLAVSLVAADEAARRRLMPVTRGNPLEELKESLARYQAGNGRRITLEYVLLKGCNDSAADAAVLKRFIGTLKVNVNLIPWNPDPALPFEEPNEADVTRFSALLDEQGVPFSRRYRRGRRIQGACGQLAVFKNRQ